MAVPHLPEAFLSFMRHELRTPINVMVGYTEIMLEEVDERAPPNAGELSSNLQRIEAGSQELLRIVCDALDPRYAIELGSMDDCAVSLRHQMLTPLHAVISHAELTMEELAKRPELDYLQDVGEVRTAARELVRLLDGFVQTYEAQAGGAGAMRRTGEDAVPDMVSSALQPPERSAPSAAGRILVVDDNASNRKVLRRRLSRMGHDVLEAESGEGVLALLDRTNVDLVLADMVMPGMSGVALLTKLKSDPRLREVPIIVVSALDELSTAARCIAAGAEDFLPKPTEATVLRARVDACLEKKRLRDRELDYLRAVTRVTDAARGVEQDCFDPAPLIETRKRDDAIGRLARVFVQMAEQVKRRQDQLQREVQQLRVQIDQSTRSAQVREITETDFFRGLRDKAQVLAERRRRET